MLEYDAFDSHGCSGNEAHTHQPRHQTERIAAKTAQPITATTRQSPPFQLIGKDGSMPLFIGFELVQFGQQLACPPPCCRQLACIDIHRAMLTRVIHLDDPTGIDGGDVRINPLIGFDVTRGCLVSHYFLQGDDVFGNGQHN